MNFSGVLAPIPTPFDERDEVDGGRLRRALGHWVTTPLRGIVVLGSNGEAVLLDDAESDRVVAIARDIVPEGRVLVVGTGRESTRATIEATLRAAGLGADAVLVRTPGFFKPQMTADAFVRHYSSVADSSPVPVLLYNFTALTGVTLPVEAVGRLSSHPNIVGLKESNGDVPRIADLVAAVPQGFNVLSGSASTFYESLRSGASGGVLAVSCVVPEICVRLFELTRQGRTEEAASLQSRVKPLAKLLGVHGVPALKAALKLVGCDLGAPRPPLAPLDDAGVAELSEALSSIQEAHGHIAS